MPSKCPICEDETHTLRQCRDARRDERNMIMEFRLQTLCKSYTERFNAGFSIELYENMVKKLYEMVFAEKLHDLRILADFLLAFTDGVYVQPKSRLIQRIVQYCIERKLMRHKKALQRQNVDIQTLKEHLVNVLESHINHRPMIYTAVNSVFIQPLCSIELATEAAAMEAETCPICMENGASVKTQCGHEYCSVCLLNNLVHAPHNATNCPVCRAKITKIAFLSKEVMQVCLLFGKNRFVETGGGQVLSEN